METIKLKYGNTITFFIPGGLLVDTDYAGTMPAFYKALKANGIQLDSITHMMATHYHPDHCGLVGQLQQQGIKLILLESQTESVHGADYIFERDGLRFIPIDPGKAEVVRFDESRAYLKTLGIAGEIIPTPSHSADSISILLDHGDCIVGDLQPMEYIGCYEDNSALQADWNRIMSRHPKRILYAHR
jgi:glyoxylase-like metal-dependent hydrolase (beta-lactamase superfamily II)